MKVLGLLIPLLVPINASAVTQSVVIDVALVGTTSVATCYFQYTSGAGEGLLATSNVRLDTSSSKPFFELTFPDVPSGSLKGNIYCKNSETNEDTPKQRLILNVPPLEPLQ